MVDKTREELERIEKAEEIIPEDIEAGKDGTGKATVILVNAFVKTPQKRLSEMTDLPLDKVRPLTWMESYEAEVMELCEQIIMSQKRLSEHYAKYHGGRIEEVEWVRDWQGTKEKQGIKEKIMLLSEKWRLSYYRHRRSIRGDHKKDVFMLAQDQMATQQQKEEGSPWDMAPRG